MAHKSREVAHKLKEVAHKLIKPAHKPFKPAHKPKVPIPHNRRMISPIENMMVQEQANFNKLLTIQAKRLKVC